MILPPQTFTLLLWAPSAFVSALVAVWRWARREEQNGRL